MLGRVGEPRRMIYFLPWVENQECSGVRCVLVEQFVVSMKQFGSQFVVRGKGRGNL